MPSIQDRKYMDTIPYREAVGSLMYLMTSTRPDIAQAVGAVSKHNNNFGPQHWTAVKRIFRYLKGTAQSGITFKSSLSTNLGPNFADADWAGNPNDRRSTTGFIFFLHSGPISWRSQRQSTVALSSTEAEYMAISDASREAIWLRSLLKDLKFPQQSATTIFEDNQGCIALAENPVHHKRTKHIDVRYHFIRNQLQKGTITLKWLDSSSMIADMLTKPLVASVFSHLAHTLANIEQFKQAS